MDNAPQILGRDKELVYATAILFTYDEDEVQSIKWEWADQIPEHILNQLYDLIPTIRLMCNGLIKEKEHPLTVNNILEEVCLRGKNG